MYLLKYIKKGELLSRANYQARAGIKRIEAHTLLYLIRVHIRLQAYHSGLVFTTCLSENIPKVIGSEGTFSGLLLHSGADLSREKAYAK